MSWFTAVCVCGSVFYVPDRSGFVAGHRRNESAASAYRYDKQFCGAFDVSDIFSGVSEYS